MGLPLSNYSQLSEIICLLRGQKHDNTLLLFLYFKNTLYKSMCKSSASLLKQALTEYIPHVTYRINVIQLHLPHPLPAFLWYLVRVTVTLAEVCKCYLKRIM